METKKELVVTFRLDASDYVDEGGVHALAFARQDAHDLIFERASMHVMGVMLQAAAHPSGNDDRDRLFRKVLENELKAIRKAAQSATYELVEIQEES